MHNIPKLVEHYESTAKRKFIALSAYVKKVEKSHTSDLTVLLKALEQKETASPRSSKQWELNKYLLGFGTTYYNKINHSPQVHVSNTHLTMPTILSM